MNYEVVHIIVINMKSVHLHLTYLLTHSIKSFIQLVPKTIKNKYINIYTYSRT